ncbi:MAG: 4Fe-4S cluster-binding domain-containing protein [Akkermansiaceae bacterium]|nr:4Fe-4S cluster-binding domain-containing protein [Akkermansiaceae bacterium]
MTPTTHGITGTPWPHEKDAAPGYAKHRKEDVTYEMDPVDAAKRVLAFGCPRTVITGGEPLLQESAFLEMIATIREQDPDHQFEVETNGTRIPSADFYTAVNQFNVSPKLANSGMPESLRLSSGALGFFASSPKSWFKFVANDSINLLEISELCSKIGIPRQRVLLMPEGRTSRELDRFSAQLAELCRDQGFRFCDRLHIRLWGDRRGV